MIGDGNDFSYPVIAIRLHDVHFTDLGLSKFRKASGKNRSQGAIPKVKGVLESSLHVLSNAYSTLGIEQHPDLFRSNNCLRQSVPAKVSPFRWFWLRVRRARIDRYQRYVGIRCEGKVNRHPLFVV